MLVAVLRLRQMNKMKELLHCCIARTERDDTHSDTRFRLDQKRTSPFKSVGGVSSVDCWQLRCAHQLE